MAVDYAYFGLGQMGYGMASNIRKKIPSTSTLYIYDIFRPACDKFISEFSSFGPIVVAESVIDAASKAKIIISSLPSSQVVRNVYLDPTNGIIAAPVDPDRLILETSTVATSSAQEYSEKLRQAKKGIYIDTPVSGGQPASLAGKLSFMIGHPKPEPSDTVGLRIQETLAHMSDPEKTFWCGNVGAGLAAKIANNYISCTVVLIVAEAMAIGVRSGIDVKLLQQVIHASSGQTFMGDIFSKVPKAQLLGPTGFPVNLMLKDVGLGIDVGAETGVETSMAHAALDIWKKYESDHSVLPLDGFLDVD